MAASSSARWRSRAHVKCISNTHGAKKKNANPGQKQKKASDKAKRNDKFANPTPGERFSPRLRKDTPTGRIQIQRAARQAGDLGLTSDCIGDPSKKLLFMLLLGLSPKSDKPPFPVVSLKRIPKRLLPSTKTSPDASVNQNNMEPAGGCEIPKSKENKGLKVTGKNRPNAVTTGVPQEVPNKLQEKMAKARPRPHPVIEQLRTTGTEPSTASLKSIASATMKASFRVPTKDAPTPGLQSPTKTKANAVVKLKKLEGDNLTATRRAKVRVGGKKYDKSSRGRANTKSTKSHTNTTVNGKGKVIDFIDISED